jgi:hypothetical protein
MLLVAYSLLLRGAYRIHQLVAYSMLLGVTSRWPLQTFQKGSGVRSSFSSPTVIHPTPLRQWSLVTMLSQHIVFSAGMGHGKS